MNLLFETVLPVANLIIAMIAIYPQLRAWRRTRVAARYLFLLGALFSIYTVVGYLLLLVGVTIDTPVYFRWLQLAWNGLFGGLAIWFTAAFEKHD